MNPQDKQIQQFLQTSYYDAVKDLITSMIVDYQTRTTIGNNEFETLKLTFMKEASVQALKSLIDNLEKDTIA